MTKEECLELGRLYIKNTGKYPVSKHWTKREHGCSRDKIYNYWGSWSYFVKDLEELIHIPNKKIAYKYTDKELLEFLKLSAFRSNNNYPKYSDFELSNSYPSVITIRNRFGSWDNACKMAGYIKSTKNESQSLTYLEALKICFKKSGYTIATNTKNITEEALLIFLSTEKPSKNNPFGFSSGGWTKFIRKTFPDCPNKYSNYNWLLLRHGLLYCSNCALVKATNNFFNNIASITQKSTYCKQCQLAKEKPYAAYKNSLYRAAKLTATPRWANLDSIKEFYLKCPEGYHVDHIIPLRGTHICGLHVVNNLQYLPATNNNSKSNNYNYWWL